MFVAVFGCCVVYLVFVLVGCGRFFCFVFIRVCGSFVGLFGYLLFVDFVVLWIGELFVLLVRLLVVLLVGGVWLHLILFV